MAIQIVVANQSHINHANIICEMMEASAKIRGTGIAKRSPKYLEEKMCNNEAVIALDDQLCIGFCYIESWEDKKYVANSGLIVHPDYRNIGLALKIKTVIFELSKSKYPNSKLFGITTSPAVMKINASLGYEPVAFSNLTQDQKFWEGCKSCVNYDILTRTNKSMCLCTGMVCDLKTAKPIRVVQQKQRAWQKFMQFLKTQSIKNIKNQLKIKK